MTRREPWMVPLLGILTCGVYLLYWQYVTTEELKRVSGRDDLNPIMDLLLSVLCCGLWSCYVGYRNAQVVHECFARRNVQHDDKSTLILVLYVVSVVNGVTALIAPLILQDEYNKLASLEVGGPAPIAY